MARNLRALLPEELDYIENKYTFKLLESIDGEKYIIVSCKDYNKKILQDVDKSFNIVTSIRKVNISTEAINLWIDTFKNEGYSLIAVQNAISILTVTFQQLDIDEIRDQLKRRSSKIKII